MVGLSMLGGVGYPTDTITHYNTTYIYEDNLTVQTNSIIYEETQFEVWNNAITKSVAIILMLGGAMVWFFQSSEVKKIKY